jgi:hypothetical protein
MGVVLEGTEPLVEAKVFVNNKAVGDGLWKRS